MNKHTNTGINNCTENYVTVERVNEDGTFIHQQEIIENKKFDWKKFPFVRYFVKANKKEK